MSSTMLPLEATVYVKLTGRVIARQDSVNRPTRYLVETYLNGREVRAWLVEDILQEVVAHG